MSHWSGLELRDKVITSLALFIGVFVLYTMTFGQPNNIYFRSLILSALIIIGILAQPLFRGQQNKILQKAGSVFDLLAVIMTAVIQCYVVYDFDSFILRQGSPSESDVFLGLLYVLLVLELCRRYCGWVMTIMAAFFFVQSIISDQLPWIFYGPPVELSTMVDFVFMRDEGIFSTPIMSIFSYVIPFIILTELMLKSGAGEVFMDLARSIAGHLSGGPAKIAIIASSLMGMISGSAVANVVGVGSVTIPLMKKTGYRAEFAGAVEAVGSTGGQIMPPVMGAAAFILAQNLQLPYIKVCLYAVIPSFLYYAALYFSVHQEALKRGLQGLPKESLPKTMQVLKYGWSVLLPMITMVIMMMQGYTPMTAALYGIVLLFVLVMVNPKMRLTPAKFIDTLKTASVSCVSVSAGCAAAGLIIAGVNISGLGLKIAGIVLVLAQGKLWLALILTMIVAAILGMGVPTTAVYVMVSVLLSPALIEMGVIPLAAHFFPFYYGVLAAITPPVALATFAAAGIAGCSVTKVGIEAVKLGLCGFIVPFMFVYSPELLLQGQPLNIAWALVTAMIGVYVLASSIIGIFIQRPASMFERALLFIAAVCLVTPGIISDAIGAGIIAVVFIMIRRKNVSEVLNIVQ